MSITPINTVLSSNLAQGHHNSTNEKSFICQ